MTRFHMTTWAIITSFALDTVLGDPRSFPHIIRWIGRLIASLSCRLPRTVTSGRVITVIVITICGGLPFLLLYFCYNKSLWLGYALESLICWQTLAARSLLTESMKVCRSLKKGQINDARKNLSMIVGRDTAELDFAAIARGAVETVAENTSDGVTAPLFYMAFGGGWLSCIYKSINTMDSMIGYKNHIYIHQGRAAAKTDDAVNLIPSRLSALLMIAAACILGFDGKNAFRLWRRDRRKHPSPNSAQTESVCAGALGIQLAGPASYKGEICEKPYIGDNLRHIDTDDIIKANKLMYCTSILMLILIITIRLITGGIYEKI